MAVFFLLFFVLILLNIPIVYCMLLPSIYYLISKDIGLTVVMQRLIAGVDSFPLLAVPLFIMAGQLMNGVGITDRIFKFCDKLVGHFTGGLAYANIIASVIFAGMSGSAIADAGGLGAIELRAMKENGYDESFSLAVTGASSLIGPIIPPSVPAIVYAVATGVSIGQLFVAGILPGLLIALAQGILCYCMCRNMNTIKRTRAPIRDVWHAFKEAFLPLMAPVIILAGTFSGVFTPTETGSVVVVYSLALGLLYRSVNLRELPKILLNTAKTTVSVTVLISASALFGWVLTRAQFPQVLAAFFTGLTSNKYVFLILINILLIIVGTFMDNSAAIPILAPILLPIALSYGIDPIQFSIMFILNLMIGLVTPPVGLVLYTLAGVSKVSFEQISYKMIPFIFATLLVLLAITFIPSISTCLPNLLYH